MPQAMTQVVPQAVPQVVPQVLASEPPTANDIGGKFAPAGSEHEQSLQARDQTAFTMPL